MSLRSDQLTGKHGLLFYRRDLPSSIMTDATGLTRLSLVFRPNEAYVFDNSQVGRFYPFNDDWKWDWWVEEPCGHLKSQIRCYDAPILPMPLIVALETLALDFRVRSMHVEPRVESPDRDEPSYCVRTVFITLNGLEEPVHHPERFIIVQSQKFCRTLERVERAGS